MKNALVLLILLTIVAAGCGSSASSDSLVRDAILHYLAGRTDLNMSKMNVAVDNLQYSGDTASAQVTISSRDDAQASMQMTYQLRRAGGGWEVVPAAGSASDAHGSMSPPDGPQAGGELPPGHPPAGGAPQGAAEGSELPQGHPPVGNQPQPTQPKKDLPAGHPPVGTR
jgi:hypothetical protein